MRGMWRSTGPCPTTERTAATMSRGLIIDCFEDGASFFQIGRGINVQRALDRHGDALGFVVVKRITTQQVLDPRCIDGTVRQPGSGYNRDGGSCPEHHCPDDGTNIRSGAERRG